MTDGSRPAATAASGDSSRRADALADRSDDDRDDRDAAHNASADVAPELFGW